MAGHENSLVRPKTYTQDPLKIAAGSPLALQGIFLEILRERFRTDAGIGVVWREDITTTDILIEASYNEETESRSQTPAIYVTRLQTVPAKIIIGDRVGVHMSDHQEGFGAIATVALSIECVSNDDGESAVLGDIIQFMLLASQDVIQREFGFYDMSHPTLGQTVPFERDSAKWSTALNFDVQFWIRWSQVPISPLLQQIATRITNNGVDVSGHFHELTLNSLRRGDVLEPTPEVGVTLPPSRVSVVGPAGPPGPSGPAGPRGVPGTTVFLQVDQPLVGVQDSINTVFTTATSFIHTAQVKEMLYLNGLRQKEGVGQDYIVSESVPLAGYDTLTFAVAPNVNDTLVIDFYAQTGP